MRHHIRSTPGPPMSDSSRFCEAKGSVRWSCGDTGILSADTPDLLLFSFRAITCWARRFRSASRKKVAVAG